MCGFNLTHGKLIKVTQAKLIISRMTDIAYSWYQAAAPFRHLLLCDILILSDVGLAWGGVGWCVYEWVPESTGRVLFTSQLLIVFA